MVRVGLRPWERKGRERGACSRLHSVGNAAHRSGPGSTSRVGLGGPTGHTTPVTMGVPSGWCCSLESGPAVYWLASDFKMDILVNQIFFLYVEVVSAYCRKCSKTQRTEVNQLEWALFPWSPTQRLNTDPQARLEVPLSGDPSGQPGCFFCFGSVSRG